MQLFLILCVIITQAMIKEIMLSLQRRVTAFVFLPQQVQKA